MLQLAPTQPIASNLRPVALRMRPDLVVRERKVGARTYFVIKDPIRLLHHQLWEEEFALLKMLDGRTSFTAMAAAFCKKYPGSRLDTRLLQILHGQFYRNGLVLSDNIGQSEELQRRSDVLKSQLWWGRVRSWMSIRFRGVNPDRALDYLDRRFGWCFESPALICIATFILFTLAFFALHSVQVLSLLPSINDYVNVNTIALVYLTFSGLKVLHEIGHGLACKHYGSECNELGLMLLIFTPCLYCDVTDSWMVESKWKRAMIAAAGMLFELFAASICMWIWWFTHPGILHSLCFHAVLIGSFGTILFNGNPLLKYDGYFVVSDLLDRPNLFQQAKGIISNGIAQFYVRHVPTAIADYSGRSNRFLWIYGLLSGIYRWVLSVVILFMVYKLFQILRLESLGLFLVLSVFAGWLYWITHAVGTLVREPGRFENLRKGRVAFSLFAAILLLALVIWLPLPSRVTSHAFLEVKDAKSVVVLVDGKLVRCQPEGAIVHAGDEIAKLVSDDLELTLVARRGELSRQRARLIGLESRRGDDILAASRIPTVQEAIAGLELEVRRLESDIEQLTLRAPVDGKIIAPMAAKESKKPNEVQAWSGTPMDAENVGCVLQRGTTFCEVGNADCFQGTVYLTQSQVELVRPGHAVYLKSKSLPNHTFRGTVSEVGTAVTPEVPLEIASSGYVPSRTNRNGRQESIEPMFLARIEIAPDSLPQNDLIPMHHSIGQVSIQIDSQSLGSRIARFVFSTFTIDPTAQRRSAP